MVKNAYGLTFHHLGLAVKTPEPAQRFLTRLGYSECGSVYDELQNVNLIMCSHNTMPDVEIIYPSDNPGPLDKILSSRNELIYHMCYTTGNLEETISAIKEDDIQLRTVSEPRNAILFGDRKVSFYMIRGFGLIEILE